MLRCRRLTLSCESGSSGQRIIRILIPLLASAALVSGCSSFAQLTPAQQAQLACVVSGGVVQAMAATPGAAQKLATQYAGAQVVGCTTATQVGAILTK